MDFNSLDRFVQAQTLMYSITLKEIQNGQKHSHWMWYMFPQLRGLGTSIMANMYRISGLGEAKAYLAQPVLSGRLYELCSAKLISFLITHFFSLNILSQSSKSYANLNLTKLIQTASCTSLLNSSSDPTPEP